MLPRSVIITTILRNVICGLSGCVEAMNVSMTGAIFADDIIVLVSCKDGGDMMIVCRRRNTHESIRFRNYLNRGSGYVIVNFGLKIEFVDYIGMP